MRLKWDNRENGTVLNELNGEQILKQDLLEESLVEEEHEETDNETCRLHGVDDRELVNCYSRPSIYKGIIYSSLSSFFFSLCSVIVKYLKNIHPCQLAVSRFIGIFLLTIPLIIFYDQSPLGPRDLRHYLFLRGIAGSTNLILRFYALRYLPIGDASVIIFSVPVFVSIFASLFLKEPCGVVQTVSVCLTMVGLCLTTKLPILMVPDYISNGKTLDFNKTANESTEKTLIPSERICGVVAALISTLFSASVYILIRKAKGAHHSVIMFNFGWVAIIETTVITALLDGFSVPQSMIEWSLIAGLSIFSFLGQVLLTQSLQLEQAGPVAVVRSATDIALALIWQLWFFGDVPDMWSIAGAFIVTVCIALTSLRKCIESLPEHSAYKESFIVLTHVFQQRV